MMKKVTVKYMAKVRFSTVVAVIVLLTGCSYIPKSIDFSKPVTITSLSDNAWVVDIGKVLDRPSRYKLSRVEAAKEAQKRGCEFFKADSLLNEQFSSFDGQQAYRCVSEAADDVFITQEMLLLESV